MLGSLRQVSGGGEVGTQRVVRSLDLAGIKGAAVDFQFIDDSVKRIRSWNRPRCGGGEFVEVAANLEGAARGLPSREVFILNLVRLERTPPGETASDFQTTSLQPIDIDGKATVGIESRGYMGSLHQGAPERPKHTRANDRRGKLANRCARSRPTQRSIGPSARR